MNISIPAATMKLLAEIDEFKGKWNAGNFLKIEELKQLKQVATLESIGSSNRIEGNTLTDMQIETFLNLKKKSFRNRDEEEVSGYADLLYTIYENYDSILLTENYIKQLHGILLKNVSKDVRHRGEYKTISNAVVAFDADGKEKGVVFQTASPLDTIRLMEELVNWFNKEIKEGYYHPLLVIGVFLVHFLAIHPFQDGNGRLSRALTTLLLLKAGYLYVPYSSMESVIEASKGSYYLALRRTQKTIWSDTVDYIPWLNFFIFSLHKQKLHLEEKIKNIETTAGLSESAKMVLGLFEKNIQLTSKEISELTGLNINTIRKILQTLLKKGYLKKYGTTINRSYVRKFSK